MTDLELAFTPAVDLARMIAARTVSPVEMVSNALSRIDDVTPQLNCFCFVWHDEALEAAQMAADAVARGETLGPLHGVPVALKDTTPTAGHRTTLGSCMRTGSRIATPTSSSPCVEPARSSSGRPPPRSSRTRW